MFSTAGKPAGFNALSFIEIVELPHIFNALQYPYGLGIYVVVLVDEYSSSYCVLYLDQKYLELQVLP